MHFTLLCLSMGDVNKFNVTWIKRGGNNNSFPFSTMNLTINATKLDSGEYYCEVTNGMEYIASPTAYINVLCEHSIPKTFIAVPLFLKKITNPHFSFENGE